MPWTYAPTFKGEGGQIKTQDCSEMRDFLSVISAVIISGV